MTFRHQFRAVAYHLSLVDAYPDVSDSTQPQAPQPGAA